jgi:branched-chain amino acid transport system permease protein
MGSRVLHGLLIALAVVLPFLAGSGNIYLLTLMGTYAIVAMSLGGLLGASGQISIGHAAFFAIGAYAEAIVLGRHLTNWWLGIIIAGFVTAIVGYIIGLSAVRLKGDFLALATLAFGVAFPEVLDKWSALTGGQAGLAVPRPGPTASPLGVYYVAVALVVVTMFVWINLRNHKSGIAWMALRDNEAAARSVGVNARHFRASIFGISAMCTGWAGAVLGEAIGYISPETFTLELSLLFLVMAVLGGNKFTFGSLVAAVVITYASQTTNTLAGASDIIFGALVVVIVMFGPSGAKLASKVVRGDWGNLRRFSLGVRESTDLGPAVASRFKDAFLRAPFGKPSGSDVIRKERTAGGSASMADAEMGVTLPTSRVWSGDDRPGAQLHLDNVTVVFEGLTAVDNVSLNVPAAEITAIIGPNGAGKTTLLNVMSRYTEPAAGSVRLDRQDIRKIASHELARLGMARTFQNLALFGKMDVTLNIVAGAFHRMRSVALADAFLLPPSLRELRLLKAEARDWLYTLGIADYASSFAGSLPTGIQRRVELARALMAHPKILLLDEPAAGLNPEETMAIAHLVSKLRDTFGITVVVIEHNMEFVAEVADSMTAMNFGKIIAQGKPKDVRNDPEVLRAYLGENVDA